MTASAFNVQSEKRKRPFEESNEQPAAKWPDLDEVVKSEEESGSETGMARMYTERRTPFTRQQPLHDEANWIHIRAVISNLEAGTIIGRGGEKLSQIRRSSGAKCTVSDYSPSTGERILTVSGPQDAVAKVSYMNYCARVQMSDIWLTLGLSRRLVWLNGPWILSRSPSNAQSKPCPLCLLIPEQLAGAIIGRGGSHIREIHEYSGARLKVSDGCLRLSIARHFWRSRCYSHSCLLRCRHPPSSNSSLSAMAGLQPHELSRARRNVCR